MKSNQRRWKSIAGEQVEERLMNALALPRPRDRIDAAIPRLRALSIAGRDAEVCRALPRLGEALAAINDPAARASATGDLLQCVFALSERWKAVADALQEQWLALVVEHGYGWKRDRWLEWTVVDIARHDHERALRIAARIHRPRFRRRAVRRIGIAVPDTSLGAPPGRMILPIA